MRFFDEVSQAEQKRESIEARKREAARESKKKGNKRTASMLVSGQRHGAGRFPPLPCHRRSPLLPCLPRGGKAGVDSALRRVPSQPLLGHMSSVHQ